MSTFAGKTGILEALTERVEALSAEVASLHGQGPAFLDKHQAAELLSLTPEAVETLSKRGKLPRVKFPNGAVRFERHALISWAKGEA